ncbi:MAG: hypothetical protein GX605_11880, partial [Chloroflexi bacterium]|nr:hypothetical protein [Chloroflexota bacterium]
MAYGVRRSLAAAVLSVAIILGLTVPLGAGSLGPDTQAGQLDGQAEGNADLGWLQGPPMGFHLSVNYGHDWVEGHYEPGHTISLSLTDATGAFKGSASGETGPIPWWGDESGFSTDYNVPWTGERPDLQPGDWLDGTVDDAESAGVRIGEILAELDVHADR